MNGKSTLLQHAFGIDTSFGDAKFFFCATKTSGVFIFQISLFGWSRDYSSESTKYIFLCNRRCEIVSIFNWMLVADRTIVIDFCKPNTLTNYNFVKNLLAKEEFSEKSIGQIKTSDAKLFLIKLQSDGKGHSTVKTVRGVLRPAFQMAVDDDVLHKNPFAFELAGVVVNDSVTREAITKEQMNKFLKFIHDDRLYCKYYEVVYILFHTGMRISEFCGLTIGDVDLDNKIVNIDYQLQRTSKMEYIIESTKTNAGTRKLPITDDVADMFRAIIEDRPSPKVEKMINGYSGFLFLDEKGMPFVAMHWQHRFNHMVGRYNDIYRVQIPNITPHVCRHTYCSNQAKSGMNPKTLQYLMGHSDISVTMNVYTHVGLDDAEEELRRMEEFRKAQAEVDKKNGIKPVSQKMFKAI